MKHSCSMSSCTEREWPSVASSVIGGDEGADSLSRYSEAQSELNKTRYPPFVASAADRRC